MESAALGFMILFFVIMLAMLAVWIYAIVDIARAEFEGDNKMIWLLIVILVGFIGALIYFMVGRSKKITKEEKDDNPYILDR